MQRGTQCSWNEGERCEAAWRAEDQGDHVKDWGLGGKGTCGQIYDVRVPLFPLSVHFWHGLLH